MYFFWSLTNNFWLESVNSPSTNFAPVASTLWCQCLHGSSGNPPVTGSEAKRLIFSSSWSIPNIIQLDVWWYKYMSSWFYSCIMLCIYIYILRYLTPKYEVPTFQNIIGLDLIEENDSRCSRCCTLKDLRLERCNPWVLKPHILQDPMV